MNGDRNLPHSNPLDAYLWNAKTVEVHKGRGEPYTITEHLKIWIKKVWQRTIDKEHMKKAIFQFRPCLQKVRRAEGGTIDLHLGQFF